MRLKLSDSNLFEDPTTLVAEQSELDGKDVVQIALFSDPQLEGEGIFLTEDKVLKLYRWLDRILGGIRHE